MVIAKAVWTVPSSIDPAKSLKVKGAGTDGIDIEPVSATYANSEISITNVSASKAFDSNLTKYFNPFSITWEMSDDDGATWNDAGTSDNEIYVALSEPSGDVTPYRTLVHLACSNDGATNAAQAVSKTWELLEGPANLQGWDEEEQSWTRPLYYYKPGSTFLAAENPVTIAGLLNVGSAECVAWALLLKHAWLLNGASSGYTIATPIGYNLLLVKDWNSSCSEPWWFYLKKDAEGLPDMIPIPPGGYGDLSNQNTIPGQNSSPPSQKAFGTHHFLKYNNVYYDPSYGVTYDDEGDFQAKSIFGFGTQKSSNGIFSYWVYAATSTVKIQFNTT